MAHHFVTCFPDGSMLWFLDIWSSTAVQRGGSSEQAIPIALILSRGDVKQFLVFTTLRVILHLQNDIWKSYIVSSTQI